MACLFILLFVEGGGEFRAIFGGGGYDFAGVRVLSVWGLGMAEVTLRQGKNQDGDDSVRACNYQDNAAVCFRHSRYEG